MSVFSCCAVRQPGRTLAIVITRKEDGQPIHLINHFWSWQGWPPALAIERSDATQVYLG